MQMRLGPQVETLRRNEAPQCGFEVDAARRPVACGLVRRTAAPWLIYDVYRVTLSQEELRPTFPPIRSAREVRPRLASAMDHHYRPWMRLLRGNLKLGVQLPAHRVPLVR